MIKKNQVVIMKVESTITFKILLEWLNSRFEMTRERVNEFTYTGRSIEMMKSD